jgi:hypothetical protein
MAREMVKIEATAEGCRISSPIPCPDFTVRLSPGSPGEWRVNGAPLRRVPDPLSLEPGCWAQEEQDIVIAFDLPSGKTTVTHTC